MQPWLYKVSSIANPLGNALVTQQGAFVQLNVCVGLRRKTTNENKVMLTLGDLMKYAHVINKCKCLINNAYM
jgi:hypothetical protein